MAMFYSHMISLAWVAIYICLLPFARVHGHGHGHGHHHRHLNQSHHNIQFEFAKRAVVPGRSKIFIDDSSCSGHISYISQTFDNVMTILTAAQSAIPVLEGAMGVARDKLTSDQKSKLDLFMALYGIFDNEDLGEIYTAKSKVDSISSFLNYYVSALSSNTFNIDVYCGDGNWKKTGNTDVEDNEKLFEYKLLDIMEAEPDWSPNDPLCQETELDEDGEPGMLGAFTTESVHNTKDFITICSSSWDDWTGRLPEFKAETLSGLKGEYLSGLLSEAVEPTFLHELTHAKSVFNDELMEDIQFKLNNEDEHEVTAYKFALCHALAKMDESETDVSKIRPLQNADTFTYFTCGLYLSECNWFDGSCRDPSTVK